MNNESDPQLDALFARARAQRVDTSAAEYAFETRLMARLRADRPASSVWAMVAWRMVPFFAVCALGMFLWQAEVATEASDAEQVAYLDSSAPLDSETTPVNL
jgi:hypothetical protein